MPCGAGDKENPIYDRGNRNQIERDSRCKRGTDKSKSDGFRTPHKKVVKNRVNRRDHEDDLGRDRKETLRLEISTARPSGHFLSWDIGHTEIRN